MSIIDELFQMEGVVAVAKIDDMGRIVDWKAKGVVTSEVKDTTSGLVAQLTFISNEIGRNALETGVQRMVGSLAAVK